MIKSWKTTAAGWVAFVVLALPLAISLINGEEVSAERWAAAGAGLSVALGLTTARDNSVTSKQAGAEK
jgi:hypothetical protein